MGSCWPGQRIRFVVSAMLCKCVLLVCVSEWVWCVGFDRDAHLADEKYWREFSVQVHELVLRENVFGGDVCRHVCMTGSVFMASQHAASGD